MVREIGNLRKADKSILFQIVLELDSGKCNFGRIINQLTKAIVPKTARLRIIRVYVYL
jgi:hypothetical protein